MENKLRSWAFELDNAAGRVSAKVEALADVRTVLANLRIDMDTLVFRNEDPRLYFREHHHSVRLLDELMFYLMEDISEWQGKVEELKQFIFHEVVKGDDESEQTV